MFVDISVGISQKFNIPFTCLSTSFTKTSGSLRGGCFIGCADPVAILCFTTLVLSADTQIIYPGTIVAQVSPVQEVVNPNSKIDEGNCHKIPNLNSFQYNDHC
jgi:hypothetical protein